MLQSKQATKIFTPITDTAKLNADKMVEANKAAAMTTNS